jgi:uncharacterized protein YndB with AHSA1/START domain
METNPDSSQSPGIKGVSRVSRIIKASRKEIYQAFTDPSLVAIWLAPDNMRCEVHSFIAREGGVFEMTLTYLDSAPEAKGKTSENKDRFKGRFTKLIPYKKIEEIIEFDSGDEKFVGEMKMLVDLVDSDEGRSLVTLLFQDIPVGIRPEDNEEGSRQSLNKLAALLEQK